jgi:lipoprotein-anchoring transpeptidase ErfK/SrfK
VIPFGHPDNILGNYFVKFEHQSFQGYGAHGTPEPETIGTMASAGCVRMLDGDIREFFRVIPRGTPVHVRATVRPGSR